MTLPEEGNMGSVLMGEEDIISSVVSTYEA